MKRYFDTEEEIRESTDCNLEDFLKTIGLAENLILSITVIWKIFRKITIITTTLFTLEPMADTLLPSPAFQIKATQDSL